MARMFSLWHCCAFLFQLFSALSPVLLIVQLLHFFLFSLSYAPTSLHHGYFFGWQYFMFGTFTVPMFTFLFDIFRFCTSFLVCLAHFVWLNDIYLVNIRMGDSGPNVMQEKEEVWLFYFILFFNFALCYLLKKGKKFYNAYGILMPKNYAIV